MAYQTYRPNNFSVLPLVVKNLLIINTLLLLASMAATNMGIDLDNILGLHYPLSQAFRPWQLVTYMFMHGSFFHLFSNMFALWMFGNTLENLWGSKRFLIYYMITGIGAGLIQLVITYLRLQSLNDQLPPEMMHSIMTEGSALLQSGRNYLGVAGDVNILINTSTIGASGAVFGILLAFGMLFPNMMLYLYFAIPVKAKWFVIFYGAFELYSGIANNPQDNVAHFAHLGGMLFGFILLKYWQKKSNHFY